MRVLKRCLLLPLFCCFALSGCNEKENEIKSYVEENIVAQGTYDNINVEKVSNHNTTIYMVYVYSHFSNKDNDISYKIDVYVYNNGSIEWVYSV